MDLRLRAPRCEKVQSTPRLSHEGLSGKAAIILPTKGTPIPLGDEEAVAQLPLKFSDPRIANRAGQPHDDVQRLGVAARP
jgi:hypothetical protein